MAIKIKHFKTRVVRYPTLALTGLGAVVALGFDRDLSKADWGTWVGAVGTVGTLVGTIWLATAEARRRRAQESARAYIVAAAMAPRLELLAADIGLFFASMAFGRPEEKGITPKHIANTFLAISYKEATTEDLLALEAMPNNCATKLAYAQAQLETIKSQIRRHADLSPDGNQTIKKEIAEGWRNWMSDLSARLDVLARECQAAANIHAAFPTSEERFGDQGDDFYD